MGISFSFYWYDLRPSRIISDCSYAKEYGVYAEINYKVCLHNKGLNIDNTKEQVNFSSIIYNIGLGLGALIGAIAGFDYIDLREKRRNRLIKKYYKKYPRELENKKDGWELAHNPERKGHLFLLDHRDKSRHWIANWATFSDLFMEPPAFGDQQKNDLFKTYKIGEDILTSGEPWS